MPDNHGCAPADQNKNNNMQPPPVPIIVAADNQTTLSRDLKDFLNLTGGSFFYCLSAFAIIYGITKTIGPLLADGKNLQQALMCVFTLNVYELLVIGILAAIVVFRNVTDDAISLIVIISLLLVASGAILGTVAYREPQKCLVIGIICSLIGLGKLCVLKKFIGLKIGIIALIGITIVLLWNFLTGTLISKVMLSGSVTREMLKNNWIIGWYVFLIGMLFVIVEFLCINQKKLDQNSSQNVFLHRYSMAWLFMVLFFAAGCAHNYAIAYMFSIKHCLGDYLPFATFFPFLLFQFLRTIKKQNPELEAFICCLPFLVMIVALADNAIKAGWQYNQNILWYPPVLMGIAGTIILIFSIIHDRRLLKYIAIAYAFMMLLTIGYSPSAPADLNWKITGISFAITLLAVGIIHKNMFICVLVAFIYPIGFGIASGENIEKIAQYFSLTPPGFFAFNLGIGLLAICIGFGKKTPQLLSVFASFVAMLAAFDYFINNSSWVLLLVAAALMMICFFLYWRTKHIAPLIILLIPIFYKIYAVGQNLSNWRAIIVGFVLLFIGASFSFLKGSKKTIPDK